MKNIKGLSSKSIRIKSKQEADHMVAWMKHLGKGPYPETSVEFWSDTFPLFFCAFNRSEFDTYMWTGNSDSVCVLSFDDLYEYGMPVLPSDNTKGKKVDAPYLRDYVFIAENNEDHRQIMNHLSDLGEPVSRIYNYDFYWRYVSFTGGTWSLTKELNNNLEFATLHGLEKVQRTVKTSVTSTVLVKGPKDIHATWFGINSKSKADHVSKWLLGEGLSLCETSCWDSFTNSILINSRNFLFSPCNSELESFDDLYKYGMPIHYEPNVVPAGTKPITNVQYSPRIDDEPLKDNIRINGKQRKLNSEVNMLVGTAIYKGFVQKTMFQDLVNNGFCTIGDNPTYTYYGDSDCIYVTVKHEYHKSQRIYDAGKWAVISDSRQGKPKPPAVTGEKIPDFKVGDIVTIFKNHKSEDSKIFFGKTFRIARVYTGGFCDGYMKFYPGLSFKTEGGIWFDELKYATEKESLTFLNCHEYKQHITGLNMDSDNTVLVSKGLWKQLDKSYKEINPDTLFRGEEAVKKILTPNVEFIQPYNDEHIQLDTFVKKTKKTIELKQPDELIYF